MKRQIIIVLATCISVTTTSYADSLLDNNDHYHVFAPTSLHETIHDAPAATTVITAADIENRGITRIEDIFRFVPGMVVSRGDGNPIRVAYHGTNSQNPRRMLIKINGVVIPYHQHFQWTRWEALYFSIHDIERVEIVRSPVNAIHGGNAAQGYIDIQLKSPEVTRSLISYGAGSQNRQEFSLRTSVLNNEKNALYFSLGGRTYDGFDEDFISISQRTSSPLPADIPQLAQLNNETGWEPSHDEHETIYGSLNGKFQFDHSELSILSGFYRADYNNRPIVYGNEYVSLIDDRHSNEVDYVAKQYFLSSDYRYNVSDNFIIGSQLNYSRHEDEEKWVDCRWANITWWPETYALYDYSIPFANSVFRPTLQQTVNPSSFTPEELAAWGPFASRVQAEGIASSARDICANWFQNTVNDRITAQIDFKYYMDDHTRIFGGFGGAMDEVESEQWYAGKVSEERVHAFVNMTNYIGNFTSNIGIYSQKLSSDDKTYNSPRVALTYKLTDYFSIKAISAVSFAESPIFARQANFSFNLDFNPSSNTTEESGQFFWHLTGNPDVKPEKIRSHSLVISGQSIDSPFSFNINIFDEKMTDVIADLYNWTAFNPSNNGVVDQEGIELEVYYHKDGFTVGGSASYIENETNRPLEQSLYAKNIYTLYTSKKVSKDTTVSFYSNHHNILDVRYDEYNLSLSQTINYKNLKPTLFIQGTYFDNDEQVKVYRSSFDAPNDYQTYISRYNDQFQIFAGFKLPY